MYIIVICVSMCVRCIAYCWSYELIPVVSKLYQTLDGLFTIARTSLTFALLKVCTSIQVFVVVCTYIHAISQYTCYVYHNITRIFLHCIVGLYGSRCQSFEET